MAVAIRFQRDSVPELCHDVMETFNGTWFTADNLVTEIQHRRPGTAEGTILRAIYRMARNGWIERRQTPGYHTGLVSEFRVAHRIYLREEVDGGLSD